MAKSDLIQIYKTSEKYPVFFVEEVIGDTLWEKQKAIINAIKTSDVTVASCHGAGKSFTASRVVLHAMATMPGTQAITTAPTNRQVKKVLWKEIRTGHKRAKIPLGGKALTQELQIDDDWFAMGFATDDTDQFQGFHGKKILVVADEAAGVSEEIFNGIDGITSGANSRKLYIGNPTSRTGRFYKSFSIPGFKKFHISAFDTPNFTRLGITYDDIINGDWKKKVLNYFEINEEWSEELWNKYAHKLPYSQLVTPKWVADKYITWGPESAIFQAKVLGQFPEDEEFTIIPIYIWKQAQEREKNIEIDDIRQARVGIDVARFGSDSSCFTLTLKNHLTKKENINKMDTTAVADWTNKMIRGKFNTLNAWKKIPINVDVTGVGAGVADRLRNVKGYENVFDVKFGSKAKDEEKYLNKRAEMYWEVREGLKSGEYKICIHDEGLENQITSIRYEIKNDRIKVEPKEKIRKRLKESPDDADSVCLAYYDTPESNNGLVGAWAN